MSETEEEKQKRWAKNRKAYMTPAMAHAMAMSKYQSQNKYKEQFNKSRGKGYTAVTSTPELEHVKQQSVRISQNKYKSDFEKNKAKFTAVADDPETLRVKRVTNQVSKIAYAGRGPAMAESKFKRNRQAFAAKEEEAKPDPTETADEVPTSYGRPLEVEETIDEESESTTKENGDSYKEESAKESESYSALHGGCSEEASGGHEGEEEEEEEKEEASHQQEQETQENGDNCGEQQQEMDVDGQEEEEGTEEDAGAGGREYREADAEEEEELKEYGADGGLDDFYANLG